MSYRLGLLAVGALLAAIPGPAAAQSGGWWNPVIQEGRSGGGTIRDAVLGRRPGQNVPQNDPRYESRYPNEPRYPAEGRGRGRGNGKNGNGPPFCRNGQGHPVHGWAWCEQKGWGGYGQRAQRTRDWQREGWNDVIFRNPAPRQGGRVGQPTIGGILGDVILGRLTRAGADAGLGGALDGRWLRLSDGSAVLQLRMGGVPLAELADTNLDGRADAVYVSRLR
jgi:hypothetical protein